MSVETATYINQLVSANPAGSDPVSDGATHLRLVKSVLKATFPNITGPVTGTQVDLGRTIPIGFIGLWYSTLGSIPAGWAVCNGNTYTRTDGGGSITAPDLRDRFVMGAGGSFNPAANAGTTTPAITVSTVGNHSHAGSFSDSIGSHSHTGSTGTPSATVGFGTNPPGTTLIVATQGHTHSISTDGVHQHALTIQPDGSHTHVATIADGRPPWFALAYIMRI